MEIELEQFIEHIKRSVEKKRGFKNESGRTTK